MASKIDLQDWVEEALRAQGGAASLIQVAKHIWASHEIELKKSGDLLYTWQYDMRWAATNLRQKRVLKSADVSPKGVWELVR
jgi:hypothetical protein